MVFMCAYLSGDAAGMVGLRSCALVTKKTRRSDALAMDHDSPRASPADLRTFNQRAMRLRILPFLLVAALAQATCTAQSDRLDVATFQVRIQAEGSQLVDVRTPEEFAKGHIAGATNNDWLEDGFLNRAKTLDKSKPVLVYCAAGGRSEDAMEALKTAGFSQVVDLRDGFNGWKRSGMPVSTK
jgi:rhodanese-related sulfurtransferase